MHLIHIRCILYASCIHMDVCMLLHKMRSQRPLSSRLRLLRVSAGERAGRAAGGVRVWVPQRPEHRAARQGRETGLPLCGGHGLPGRYAMELAAATYPSLAPVIRPSLAPLSHPSLAASKQTALSSLQQRLPRSRCCSASERTLIGVPSPADPWPPAATRFCATDGMLSLPRSPCSLGSFPPLPSLLQLLLSLPSSLPSSHCSSPFPPPFPPFLVGLQGVSAEGGSRSRARGRV